MYVCMYVCVYIYIYIYIYMYYAYMLHVYIYIRVSGGCVFMCVNARNFALNMYYVRKYIYVFMCLF